MTLIKHCGEKTAVSQKCLPWESSHVVSIALDERTFFAYAVFAPCLASHYDLICVFSFYIMYFCYSTGAHVIKENCLMHPPHAISCLCSQLIWLTSHFQVPAVAVAVTKLLGIRHFAGHGRRAFQRWPLERWAPSLRQVLNIMVWTDPCYRCFWSGGTSSILLVCDGFCW